MTTDNSLRDDVQAVLDSYAREVDGYASKADKFRRLNRWTGDNPVLLVVDAAVTTTGLAYFGRAKPMAERFRDEFIETGRATTFDALATLDDDDDFTALFSAARHRTVATEVAHALQGFDGSDLAALQVWAESASPAQYRDDPVGSISGGRTSDVPVSADASGRRYRQARYPGQAIRRGDYR